MEIKRVTAAACIALACSRENPRFDEPTSTTDDADVVGNDGATGPATNGTTMFPDRSTSDGAMTSDDATGAPPVDQGGMHDGTGAQCEPIPITLFDPEGRVQGATCGEVFAPQAGLITQRGSVLSVSSCAEGCPCAGGIAVPSTIEIGDVFIPTLPVCGRVFLWSLPTAEGACDWTGIAVTEGNADVPVWIATNGRVVPTRILNGLLLGFVPAGEPCPGERCDFGPMALDFPEGTLAAGDLPKLVTLNFAAGIPYEVEVRMARVDEACIEHFAWTAQD